MPLYPTQHLTLKSLNRCALGPPYEHNQIIGLLDNHMQYTYTQSNDGLANNHVQSTSDANMLLYWFLSTYALRLAAFLKSLRHLYYVSFQILVFGFDGLCVPVFPVLLVLL